MTHRLARASLVIGCALSLVLCVTAGLLWARSYWVADFLRVALPRPAWGVRHAFVITGKGGIGVGVDTGDKVSRIRIRRRRPPAEYGDGGWPETTWLNRQGFATRSDAYREGMGGSMHGVIVPGWFLVTVTMIGPVWMFTRWRERRRLRLGLCLGCGHPLQPGMDRCPWCGTVATAHRGAGEG